jgi:hypothetical protein
MRSAPKKRPLNKRKLSEEPTKRKWVCPVILPYAIPGADLVLGLNKLFANIDETGDAPEYVSEIARVQFERVFRDCFVRLLQLAEGEYHTVTKQWAATVLAWVDGNLGKHRVKLEKMNPAYRETAKIGIRADVALPKSPVGQILQEELRTAEHYRFKLLVLRELFEQQPLTWVVTLDRAAFEERKRNELVLQLLAAGSGWVYGTAKGRRKVHLFSDDGIKAIEKRAREAMLSFIYPEEVAEKNRSTWDYMTRAWKVPKEYWPLAGFPELSLDPDVANALKLFQEASKKWWAFIWSRIKQKQDTLLPRLRDHAKGRAAAKKKGVLYLKHFQKECQNHWQTLVRERMAGTF